MFDDLSPAIHRNPPAPHYGVAVVVLPDEATVPGKPAGAGRLAFCVAGYGGPNRLLVWEDGHLVDVADPVLSDHGRMAIGVAAADLDGDGVEEIYVLNADTFAGRKAHGDRIFARVGSGPWGSARGSGGRWLDLFDLPENIAARNPFAGRSVVAVDRRGRGRYGFAVANYGGPFRLYEVDARGRLIDAAPDIGLDRTTGGRALLPLPSRSGVPGLDLFAANENGANFYFRAEIGVGYAEVAQALGLTDPSGHGRGVAAVDLGTSHFAIAVGNWEGRHRLWTFTGHDQPAIDLAPPAMAAASRIRTVIAADFDNDGRQELAHNNIGQPNRLFRQRDGDWAATDCGAFREPNGLGTGAAVADIDGDGRLELLVAHGESAAQPLTLYRARTHDHGFLRVRPLTASGAPARGALVTLVMADGTVQRRLIDAGSGYLCQMEPVAHFGLGRTGRGVSLTIRWPDGAEITRPAPPQGREHLVLHPQSEPAPRAGTPTQA